jgi:hypothetical protein
MRFRFTVGPFEKALREVGSIRYFAIICICILWLDDRVINIEVSSEKISFVLWLHRKCAIIWRSRVECPILAIRSKRSALRGTTKLPNQRRRPVQSRSQEAAGLRRLAAVPAGVQSRTAAFKLRVYLPNFMSGNTRRSATRGNTTSWFQGPHHLLHGTIYYNIII